MGTILQMKGIRKEFPGVVALDKVDISLEKGKVLALLGENGAGKSTLMKILSGSYQPDKGEIFIDGKKTDISDVVVAKEYGISIIYQELSLSPNMTVAENIYSLIEPSKFGLIQDSKMEKMAQALLDRLSIDIKPGTYVGNLSIANQQMVEIAKALVGNPRIVIMDEPTSALSEEESEKLFTIISNLKKDGVAIVYISHRMEEIFKNCDQVTVLRDGEYIDTVDINDTTEDDLVKMMVGRDMEEIYPEKPFPFVEDKKLLEIKNYTNSDKYKDINFFVRPGEIVGLYGLMGSGRTEIARGIFGHLPKEEGQMLINGEKVDVNSPADAIKHNIAFVTENRKEEGLVLNADVTENITFTNLNKVSNALRLIDGKKEKKIAESHVANLRIKTPSIYQIVKNLSGGNQQKVVLSKWFEINPEILILDEPTRGIDVGAKYEIYKLIIDLASKGVGIIMISSELSEVLNLSDRLLVVDRKSIIAELNPKEASQEEIMSYITKGEGVKS